MGDRIIYAISTEDVNTVTQEIYEREPTEEEIEYLDRDFGDHIAWFDAIEQALYRFHEKEAD